MGTIYLSLSEVLHEKVYALAGKHKVSVNSLVTSILAEKILTLRTEENPTERARKRDASQAKNALPKVATHRMEWLRD